MGWQLSFLLSFDDFHHYDLIVEDVETHVDFSVLAFAYAVLNCILIDLVSFLFLGQFFGVKRYTLAISCLLFCRDVAHSRKI